MKASPTDKTLANQSENPLSLLHSQSWRDSIGQAAGLFIYPGSSIALRLCYDPQAINTDTARHLLEQFKYQMQHLSRELAPTPSPETAFDTNFDINVDTNGDRP